MDKTKVGVIGVGYLGRHHARNYFEMDDAHLVGVYDLDPVVGQKVAADCHTEYYSTISELLAQVDAVNIATPTQTHYEVAKQALQAAKHVLVEKPIAVTCDEGRELVELAREKNCLLQVGHIERFNGGFFAVKDRIESPLFIESHRLAPFNPRGTDVSVIQDLMIHDLDIILSVVRHPLRHMHAVGVPVISKSIDIANVRLEFDNGCVANVTTSRVSAKVTRKIRFFQTNGYFSVDFFKKSVDVVKRTAEIDEVLQLDTSGYTQIIGGLDLEELRDKLVSYEHIVAEDGEPLRRELQAFLHSIRTNSTPVVSGEDGLAALELAQSIIAEIETNRAKLT